MKETEYKTEADEIMHVFCDNNNKCEDITTFKHQL